MSAARGVSRTKEHLNRAAGTLSEMVDAAVQQTNRRRGPTKGGLAVSGEEPEVKCLKELAALLKDVASVVKALDEEAAGEGTATGVVLLPTADAETDETLAETTEGEPQNVRRRNDP